MIEQLAGRQHGVVSRAQLVSLGLSRSAIGRGVASGRLVPLHPGVYAVGPIEAVRRHEMAAVLAGGPGSVLSHTSALRVRGVPLPRGGGPIHVIVPGRGLAGRPGVRFHRVSVLEEDEYDRVHGIPATSPGRSLVDCAGLLSLAELERAVALTEREGLIELAELAALLVRYAGRRGVRRLRALVGDGRRPHLTRSEAERRCLRLIADARLPRPETNVAVGPYVLDFYWPRLGVAVEVDGYAFHSARRPFERDHRRDSWLEARGIRVVRLTWRQITEVPLRTAVELGRVLAIAEVERVGRRAESQAARAI